MQTHPPELFYGTELMLTGSEVCIRIIKAYRDDFEWLYIYMDSLVYPNTRDGLNLNSQPLGLIIS